jgi:hypothetical protein
LCCWRRLCPAWPSPSLTRPSQRRAKCDGALPACGECARSGAECERPNAEDDGRKRRKRRESAATDQSDQIGGANLLVQAAMEAGPASASASGPPQAPLSLDQLFPYPEHANPNSSLPPDPSTSLFPAPVQHRPQQPASALPPYHSPTPPSTASFDLFTPLDAAEAVASLQTAPNLPLGFVTNPQPDPVNHVSFNIARPSSPPTSTSEPAPRLHYLR